MNLLITGVAGFLGSNLADAIPAEHYVVGLDNLMRGDESRRNLAEIKRQVEFYEGDIRNEKLVKNIVREEMVDFIFHLAALPSHRLALTRTAREYADVDLMGTLNVLEAAKAVGAKVCLASSNKVYGSQKIPFREDMQKRPEGWYGQSKASAEEFCQQVAKYDGVSSAAIRFHHAIGKRCHSELVLPIFVENALEGKSLVVNGKIVSGTWQSCAADFTFVDDVVGGLLLFLNQDNALWTEKNYFDVFNFGTGRMRTILELAEIVKAETKSDSPIVQGMAMAHESLEHLASTGKTKEILNYELKTSLETAVTSYVEWRLKDI